MVGVVPWQWDGNEVGFKVPSDPNRSGILGFEDIRPALKFLGVVELFCFNPIDRIPNEEVARND